MTEEMARVMAGAAAAAAPGGVAGVAGGAGEVHLNSPSTCMTSSFALNEPTSSACFANDSSWPDHESGPRALMWWVVTSSPGDDEMLKGCHSHSLSAGMLISTNWPDSWFRGPYWLPSLCRPPAQHLHSQQAQGAPEPHIALQQPP